MQAADLNAASDLYRELNDIVKCLKEGKPRATLSVVTRSDLGQDFDTKLSLHADVWKPMLKSRLDAIVEQLNAMGVEVKL